MGSIKKELAKGVAWTGLSAYTGQILGIIITMILARLLSPTEFGLIALATVVSSFLGMLSTMGIGPAIIQRKDLTQDNLNSIFTFTLIVGLTLGIILFCSSWPIAAFYEDERLIPITQIMAVLLFLGPANMVPEALMNKNKRFKENAERSILLQVISGAIAIYAAWNGAGVYSLLIAPFFTSVGTFIWNRRFYKVYIDWHLNIEPIKRIFSFSFYQLLFDTVNYFSRNLDKLIIGKYLSMDDLGLYEKSYRMMQMPLHQITFVITPVLHPLLKDFQNDLNEIHNKITKLIRFLATISFPVGITLSCCSEEIITFMYGNKWEAAIPIFQVLALSVPLQLVFSSTGVVYLVCNNTKLQFWIGIRNTITTIAGFIIALYFWGTTISVAWSFVITMHINFFISHYVMYKYALKKEWYDIYKNLAKPLCILLVLALYFYAINLFISDYNIIIRGTIKIAGAGIISALMIQSMGLIDLSSKFKQIMNKINNRHAK